MCCCKKKPEVRKPKQESEDYDEEIPGFCYFYVWEGTCFFEWVLETPDYDGLLLCAKPSKRVPTGKFKPTQLYDATTEHTFLNSIQSYIKEVSPFLPVITMMSDANEKCLGFQILLHQPGNNVIGDRIVKLKPGVGSAYIEGTDCITVTLLSDNYVPETRQSLRDFVERSKTFQSRISMIDPQGRKPPMAVV